MKKRRFKQMLVTLSVFIASMTFVSATSVAANKSTNSDQGRITDFVKIVHDLYGYDLDSKDYSVVKSSKGVAVVPSKDINNLQMNTSKVATASVVESRNSLYMVSSPPTDEALKAMRAAGELRAQGNIEWAAPDCGSFTSSNGRDNEMVGSEVFCRGWGFANFNDPGNRNFAWQAKNTCIADHGPHNRNYELYDCGVNTAEASAFNPWKFRDFSPGADLPQSACTPVNLSVTWGGFGGGISFQGCKDLVDMDVRAAPYHLSRWLGEVQGQQRQAGQLIIIGEPEGLNASIGIQVGYNYRECGSMGNPCNS